MTKPEARRRARAALPEITARREESARLCEVLAADAAWRAAAAMLMFLPMADEPDLRPLMAAAWATGKTVAAPRLAGGAMAAVIIKSVEDVRPSAAYPKLAEPAGERVVAASAIDFALVPGVAFTRGGVRLGRGAGHYDRYLPALRPDVPRVGVCFAGQVADALPAEPHDVRMTHLATAAGVVQCG